MNLTDNIINKNSLEYIDKEIMEMKDRNKHLKKRISRIIFNTNYYGVPNKIIIDKTKLDKWRDISEYIDVLMSSYHDDETLELYLNDTFDLYSLIIIFKFFDTNKIMITETEYKLKIINGLAYFGINSDILNSIKKGLGFVWKLCDIDYDISEKEKLLKIKLNDCKNNLQELQLMDNELILNKDNYNLLYEKLHENYPIIKKQYETINTIQTIHPEFDLAFIKQEFEKLSNHLFDDIEDCIVTGGMVSKHFTYNSYFIDTDYDVFILTKNENDEQTSQKKAIDIITKLYNRLNSKIKTHIIKTKNTITLYNSKFEIQIITKLYNNITEVFTHFDLDSCCVGYSNGNLYALPRFIRSLAYSGNIFDPERQSPS